MPIYHNESGFLRLYKEAWKIAVFILLYNSFTAQAQIEELTLKALFLEAAIRFINWPDSKDGTNLLEDTFVVGVFAHDRMLPCLEKVFFKKRVKNKEIRFLKIDSFDQISKCSMIIIPSSKKGSIDKIINITSKNPVLTVSDSPELIIKGVMLSLGIEKSRITCYINESEASKAGFKISHHLLQKSKVISSNQEKKYEN